MKTESTKHLAKTLLGMRIWGRYGMGGYVHIPATGLCAKIKNGTACKLQRPDQFK